MQCLSSWQNTTTWWRVWRCWPRPNQPTRIPQCATRPSRTVSLRSKSRRFDTVFGGDTDTYFSLFCCLRRMAIRGCGESTSQAVSKAEQLWCPVQTSGSSSLAPWANHPGTTSDRWPFKQGILCMAFGAVLLSMRSSRRWFEWMASRPPKAE